jgi:glycosyltransferase involved in cell wall biosynthesis
VRIAYIINSVEGGGAAAPVPALTRVMRDCGAAVRVFALTLRDGRALPPMIAAGLDPLVRPGGLHDHIAAMRWLARETRAWGATHLWTSLSRATMMGLVLSRWRGLPAICWQHAAFLKPGNRRLLRLLQGQARLWIADSACVAELTAERLKVEPARLVTWPIFAADPAAPVSLPWQPGSPLHIGSLGRLHPVKGFDILLAALAQLRSNGFVTPVPLRVTIAGEGAQRAQLERMVREFALGDVTFSGFTDQSRRFLAEQHLYVQPSRSEGFGIAAHEAMVAGLPVLASAVGEMPHTIHDGVTGFLFPRSDVTALATALQRALSRPEHLHTIGAAARTAVLERYSLSQFTTTGRAIMDRVAAMHA